MGTSTDGQISYGVIIEEDFELPWDSDEFDGEIDDWWRHVNGFKDIHQPWADEGGYAKGWWRDDPRFAEYYGKRSEWEKDHPLPVEIVNAQSGDFPLYILSVPGSVLTARRGYPMEFDPQELSVHAEDRDALLAFIEKYGIPTCEEPSWILSSYWDW